MIVIGVLGLIILVGLTYSVVADGYSEISIKGEPTYELMDRDTVGVNTFSRYLINITFVNTGTADSEELTVDFTDEEGFPFAQTFSVNMGEEKIVTFNWSTLLFKNQNLIFKYNPKNLDSPWYQYNSGTKSLTLKMTGEETGGSIPGFEIFAIIFALIISTIYFRKKKKL
ncbi:MAG: hypothetical protein KAW45_03735 [Thermoplasmatales archaeon]|nr:hypothetical protein [Thermoplasmatales archaeon]